jgi:hypothetical protein
MTALKEFDRLEAVGLWRASPEDQRREVIVSLGDATLTMSDSQNQALAHWSLAAVQRAKSGEGGALYHPDGDPSETLEFAADEEAMIEAIEHLRRVIERRRPRPGKLRLYLGLSLAAGVAALAVTWLPQALRDYTVSVLPEVKQAQLGEALVGHLTRVTGTPCGAEGTMVPLERLQERILGAQGRIVVVPDGNFESAHLPGGIVVLNRSVVEDHEDPDAAAGYVLAEKLAAALNAPIRDLVTHAGLISNLRLVTTGQMSDAVLMRYAETLMQAQKPLPPFDALIKAFDQAELRSSAFAYAKDVTGESTLPLIEADPRRQSGSRQVLSDSDWIRLQGICGG